MNQRDFAIEREERFGDSLRVNGLDVYQSGSGRVRKEWLSRCEEERALTQDLMSEVTDLSNLGAAMRHVVLNKGSAGADGMSVKDLEKWFNGHYKDLIISLQKGRYEPEVVKGVEIGKPNGGLRELGIPTVKDRLVQQAIHQVLSKYYDPTFSEYSYGFRPRRNAHECLRQAGDYVGEGYKHVVDIDLAKFFDEVNHDRLLWHLSLRISDKRLLKLINKFLKSGIMRSGLVSQRIKGTPQGSPLSPLLSNIILDELDKELECRGHRFVRYADDMIILVRSQKASERAMASVTKFIEERLKLRVNLDKSGIRRPVDLNFLGHRILGDGGLGLSEKSEQRLRVKLKSITSRSRGISLTQMIKELNPKLRGWLNYFKNARMKGKMGKLMSWLRRRLRCFRLKQCKRAIGIARFLQRCKVPEWRSWLLALSSKGWYHLSNTPQAHEAMNLNWFKELGLYDLYSHYCSKFKEIARYVKRMPGGVRGR